MYQLQVTAVCYQNNSDVVVSEGLIPSCPSFLFGNLDFAVGVNILPCILHDLALVPSEFTGRDFGLKDLIKLLEGAALGFWNAKVEEDDAKEIRCRPDVGVFRSLIIELDWIRCLLKRLTYPIEVLGVDKVW